MRVELEAEKLIHIPTTCDVRLFKILFVVRVTDFFLVIITVKNVIRLISYAIRSLHILLKITFYKLV